MVKKYNVNDIRFDGDRLCLNYINTIDDRFTEKKNDYLQDANDLIRWGFHAKIIDSNTKKLLEKILHQHPSEARSFFNKAIILRELLYHLFKGIIRNEETSQYELEKFNNLLPDYYSSIKLKQTDKGYKEIWSFPKDSLYLITAPVIKDAHELLLLGKIARIKECPNCGWLFFDNTKNGKRRWCSMETCGSRIKAKEWYKRQKEK